MVPPASQSRTSNSSTEEPDTPVTLTRTTSNRSDTSSYSSTLSFSSASSVSGGRRTIIPLYSLQAHNVMTNVIVDAGTDAKIAKLQRRGMEFIDLAVLEPVEVWGERSRAPKTSRSATPDPSTPTAASSSASLSSCSPNQPTPTIPPPRFSQPQPQPSRPQIQPQVQLKSLPSLPSLKRPSTVDAKRSIFGKMFKKGKDTSSPVSPAPSGASTIMPNTPTPTPKPDMTPTPSRARGHVRNLSAGLNAATPRNRSNSPNPRTVQSLYVPGQEEFNASTNDLHGVSSEERVLRPPVLGIQPSLSYSYATSATGAASGPIPSSLPKSARALMYVWFVRKWLKRRADNQESEGLLGVIQTHTSRRASAILMGNSGALEEGVEVRFEWKRSGKTKRGKGRERQERKGSVGGTVPLATGVESSEIPKGKERKLTHRLSVISHHSLSTNFSMSEEGSGSPRSGTPTGEQRDSFSSPQKDRDHDSDDDGYDSDPEDSETPWVCTLKIRRTGTAVQRTWSRSDGGHGSANGHESRHEKGRGTSGTAKYGYDELGVIPPSAGAPQILRIKVGTLSPTPHHPKVVAMLKVPFPLPDVEIERMGVSRRPSGELLGCFLAPATTDMLYLFIGYTNPRPPPSQWEGTTLTAEEIKDVVCSTGLWLVVREGFGGVGRVSRKGDGWRIRA